MLKIRIEGTREEIDWLLNGLRKTYDVRTVSKFYPNRDGKTHRIYVEVSAFFVRSGSVADVEVSAEPKPKADDAVLGGK